MKKIKLYLIPVAFFAVILTSCNYGSFFSPRVMSLEIKDDHSSYQLSDIYDNENLLSISAKYTDGSIKKLPYNDEKLQIKVFSKISEHAISTIDTSKPFPTASTYSVQAIYDQKIQSNTIEINVIEKHVYVTSLSLSGLNAMEVRETLSLTTTVQPANYTTELNYTVSEGKKSYVDLVPTETGVDVIARKACEIDIIVSSLSSKDTTISASHHIVITGSSLPVTMEQTYNDFVKNDVYPISSTPLLGSPKLLVIPVWFKDSYTYIRSTDYRKTVREDIEKAYLGSKEEIGWHSVASYYEEESHGKLKLTGKVSDWYECGRNSTDIGVLKANSDEFKAFIKGAVDWFFENNPLEKRADYDYDKDGILDGVMLIYAAPDYTELKNDNLSTLWAFCFWIQKTYPGEIYPNAFFWASYDFMYGDNARAKTGSSYGNGYTKYVNIDAHTYIHEMGHMFGLEDYYDYSKSYKPAGGFSMQDYNVGGHDPFSLMAFGWADPYIPEDSMEITINSFSEYHDLILLSPEFNTYLSPFDEYLLLELYTPTSTNSMDSIHRYMGETSEYPTGSDEPGIRLWHVDARLAVSKSTNVFELSTSANVKQGKIITAFSNTYNENNVSKDYLSKLGPEYYDYNILQLLRNYNSATDKMTTTFVKEDLFMEGDSFSMDKFSKQFINGNLLNNNKTLGWTFTVKNISTDYLGHSSATIQLNRI